MEKKLIGEKALTKAEKQEQYHQKLSPAKKAKNTKDDKERKKLKRSLIRVDADKYTEYKKKQREDKKRKRDSAEEKADDFSITASMHEAVLCRSLKRVKGSLPKKKHIKELL